jgi:methylmalonyl-CoA epimerase
MSQPAPRRIHHVDIVVRDLDHAVEQYRRILGIDPGPRESLPERGIDLVRFRVGETWLILVQPTRDRSPVASFLDLYGEGFFHMGIQVDDVQDHAQSVRARGIRLDNEEPREGVEGWRLIDVDLQESMGAMLQFVEDPED